MFRDLRARVSRPRQVAAWIVVVLLLVVGAFLVPRLQLPDRIHTFAHVLRWSLVAYLAVRLVTWVLLDPLLSQRQTETPGFARDLLVVVLYVVAAGGVLREVAGFSLSQVLGTGAIAAAVIGLSLQETLGNLFAGISLHLDPTFQVGDWIEIVGAWRGGARGEVRVGRVESMSWRAVQLVTWNGDTDLVPNRILAQSVVTNLYAPAGLHRRTVQYVVQPTPRLHRLLDLLAVSLAGLPHLPQRRPKVVAVGTHEGGVVLEAQFWALGFRHTKATLDEINRLMATVLPREGFPLLGPAGPTTPVLSPSDPSPEVMAQVVERLKLPAHWAQDLQGRCRVRQAAPGEGLIREGDPGDSIFGILSGTLEVVQVEERTEPYNGLFWMPIAELGAGEWFGEASLLTGAPRNATVVARTECELVEIPKAAFESGLKREPEVLGRMLDLLESRRLREPAPAVVGHPHSREHWMGLVKAWFGMD